MTDDAKMKITEAAFEEFAEKGKAGARMQSIADRAGVNKAMLNYYFSSKDQLYIEVVDKMLAGFSEAFIEVLEPIDDPKQFLRTFITLQNDMTRCNRNWTRLILFSLVGGETDLDNRYDELGITQLMTKKFQQFMDQGKMRKVDPLHIILHTMSLHIGNALFMQSAKGLFDIEDEDIILENRSKAIIDMLENGLFDKNR